MSSLRLALKQSLQETGHLVSKEKKKKKASSVARQKNRSRQPGDPPRKRGRPPKHSRQISQTNSDGEIDGLKESSEDKQRGDEEENYSSENEFSYESETSHEYTDDDEEEEDEDEGEDQVDEGEGAGAEARLGNDGEHQGTDGESDGPKAKKGLSDDELSGSDEERRKVKMLKKKLKDSAANKIQSQWKKLKKKSTGDGEIRGAIYGDRDPSNEHRTESQVEEAAEQDNSHVTGDSASSEGKKKRRSGTVPAPVPEVLEWARNMTEKKSRRHVAKGMRVKVRFATKVKREGKVVKKKIWYGGRVSRASLDGSKIKIKYDDGTSEISQFPDKDVVVCDTENGNHAEAVRPAATKFIPPSLRGGEVSVEEEVEVAPEAEETSTEVEQATPPAEGATPQEDVLTHDKAIPNESEALPEISIDSDKKTISIEEPLVNNITEENIESNIAEIPEIDGIQTQDIEMSNAEPTETEVEKDTVPVEESSDNEGSFRIESSDQTPSEDPKPSDATLEENAIANLPEKSTDDDIPATEMKDKEPKNAEAAQKKSKPTLTIRISNVKANSSMEEKPETPNHETISESRVYSSDEELHADTPVTERKVKSIKIKRKRPKDASPDSSSPYAKKRRSDNDGEEADLNEVGTATSEGPSPKKTPKTLSISLKRIESVEVPSIPALSKMKKKDSQPSLAPGGSDSPVPQGESSELTKDEEEQDGHGRALEPDKEIFSEVPQNSSSADDTDPVGKLSTSASAENAGTLGDKESESFNDDVVDSADKAGRKAAKEAKEKLSPKEDPNEKDNARKKKKRRRKEGDDGEDSDEDDRQWVQCDLCKKWRILPSRVQASSLPDEWYCRMNTYDPKHMDCSAPEQTAKQVAKEWRRARKRIKQQRLEQAAFEAGKDVEKTDQSIKIRGSKSPVNSPKSVKQVISRKLGDAEGKRASPVGSMSNDDGMDPVAEAPKGEKRGRKPKKDKLEVKAGEPEKASEPPSIDITPKKPGRKRGRPARNANPETGRSSAQESRDDDNVEWVQCEKCEKWRKLPPYMSADELPDTWYCSMNTWNTNAASCETPEDKADAHHQEVGVFGNIPQGHASKYSYRSMIYGNGRKQNRPMSEKSRAAESLFQRPEADDNNPQTSVLYAKSTMFLPRTSNFHKAQVVEEKTPSIFDILSESELWAELRGVGQTMELFSSGVIGSSRLKFLTYDTLPDNMKETMREVVLQALGLYVLTGEEVIEEAQRFPWERLPAELSTIRSYINADIVIHTLLALVREGTVEMTCLKDMSKPMTEWVPRYRRVLNERPRRNVANEDIVKTSKCMKIAKPWKHVDNTEEWITGGQ